MIKIENLQMYLEKIIKSENGLASQADVIMRQMKISLRKSPDLLLI